MRRAGIAAALGAGDSPELHRQDTLAAGAALCDAAAVQVLVEEGPARVRELQTAGADFDLDPDGRLKLGREAAHSKNRIVHAHGDQTGAEVARTLVARVQRDRAHSRAREGARARPDRRRGACYGVRASIAGRATEIIADATVLATGGCGQVYRYTTNPVVATGDGFAIAHRAGVTLADMEFVQFHPTALDTPENPLALISEAVRGEGAILVNSRGMRFMLGRHRLAELAPRDVVARAIFRERRQGPVFLDARKLGAAFVKRFPGIFALCQARGIDPRKDLIPVTPAAHYMMGGVVTDLSGRSSVARLYAVGEVARTGVHGANRLASNSLLEGLVFAERVARDIAKVRVLREGARRGQVEGASAPRSRRRAGGGRRHSRRDVGGRRHRAHGARAPHRARATRRHRVASAGGRDRGAEHAADRSAHRRGGAHAQGVARRALSRGLPAGEADLEGATHRTVSGERGVSQRALTFSRMGTTGITERDEAIAALQGEIKALAKERNAVILAHNYERAEVQDVADFVGDSLGLSREAAKTSAEVIVFCGVHFMAETAAILSPKKTVLLPDLAAGCSLASTIDADALRAMEGRASRRGRRRRT